MIPHKPFPFSGSTVYGRDAALLSFEVCTSATVGDRVTYLS